MCEVVYKGRTLVYASDDSSLIDYTTDAQFYQYMQLRIYTPERVVLFDTRHALEAELRKVGIMA